MSGANFDDSKGLQGFALAMAETALGVALYDAQDRLQFWNDRFRALCGYPYEKCFTGCRLADQVAWGAAQGFYGSGDPGKIAAERLGDLARPGSAEIYYFRSSGLPVVWRSWRNPDGTLLCLAEERFDHRKLIDAASDSVVVGDHKDRIAELNPAAEALFGFTRSEVYGRPTADLFAEGIGLQELLKRGWSENGTGGKAAARPVALHGRRKRGGQFIAEVSVIGIGSGNGQFPSAIIRDVSERLRAEEALRESRTALERRIQEHDSERRRIERLTKIGHWSWAVDPAKPGVMDGVLTMSDSLLAICGLPQGLRWTNRDFLERAIHPDDQPKYLKVWIENTGVVPWGVDFYRIIRPDGEIRQVYNLYEGYYDETGRLLGENATMLDVTDIKRTEAALQRYQALQSTMERIAGVGGWEIDVGEGREVWTDGLYLILGRSREDMEASTQTYLACVHEEDRQTFRTQLESALRDAVSSQAAYRVIRPSGEQRIVSSRVEILRDERNGVLRIIGAVADVTNARQAEEALRKSRAALERRVQEHESERRRIERLTKAGHWGWKNDPDKPGMLDAPIIMSESFIAICGLRADARITMHEFLEHIVHPQDREQLRKSWMENLGLTTTGIDAFRIVRPDGEIRSVYDMYDPVRDESGQLVGDNATLLDVTEIKRTEAALQRQQTLLLSMERIAGVGGWEFDAVEDKEIWTDGLYLILGRNRQDMAPSTENYLSCVHAEDRATLQAQFEGALRGATASEAEYRVVRPDGAERMVSSRIEILRDEQNRVQRIIGAVLDVTQARRAEEALRDSQAALERRIQEHDSERRRIERLTKIGYWSWARNPANPTVMDGLVTMSNSFLALCGLPKGLKWTNRDFLERVVHPEDRERVQRLWIDMTGVEFAGTDDFRIVLPDGQVRYVYNLWESFYDDAGNVLGDNQTLLDATDIKRTEADLQRHQALLSTMERISGVGGWEFDPGESRVIWTDGLYLILGRTRESMEPSTENYLACVHDEDRDFVRAQVERALRGESSAEAEYRIARSGGEERIVSARIEVLRDEHDRVRRIMGAVADRTEARRTEAALRQAQRLEAVGHLTGGIAHDFNNLLGVITGNLELLLESPGIDARTQRLVKRAVEGARHGADLTKRLLAFSRRQALWPRNVDLNELLARMVGMLERTLGEQISVEVRPAADLWPCRVDPAQINDTILNLAINARDAMPKGGRLILATENVRLDESYAAREADIVAGDYVSLNVSDSGIGMSPDVLARVFEPFYTTKDEGKGTGLGLSMVWGFVKQSKGHIRIYSEVGRGTTVRIYLPRATAEDARDAEPAQLPRDLPRGSETLLVVEDNERLRRIAVEQLESLGYAVLEAENAEAALAMLTGHPEVALVYSDIVMSGPMTGYDLAREASTRYPNLKVLLATGYASQSLALPKPEENHFTVLHKPVPLRELAANIRNELEIGASRQPVG